MGIQVFFLIKLNKFSEKPLKAIFIEKIGESRKDLKPLIKKG